MTDIVVTQTKMTATILTAVTLNITISTVTNVPVKKKTLQSELCMCVFSPMHLIKTIYITVHVMCNMCSGKDGVTGDWKVTSKQHT